MGSNTMGDGPDDVLEEGTVVDPWSACLPGAEFAPAYLVSRYAAQYRAVVDVLNASGLSAADRSASLRDAFHQAGIAVHEEQLLGALITDLEDVQRGRGT
jgi:hypothetical protein